MARPVGTTNRPQFHTYTTEHDRKAFVEYIRKTFKHDPMLAKWYGDQLFGKAPAQIDLTSDGKPLLISNDEADA